MQSYQQLCAVAAAVTAAAAAVDFVAGEQSVLNPL